MVGSWEVLLPETKFKCHSISDPCPRSATAAVDLGDSKWIVALKDGQYLKMVKIKVTGESSYDWLETRYNHQDDYDASCETAFSESCFVHIRRDPPWPQPEEEDSYKLLLSACYKDDNKNCLGRGMQERKVLFFRIKFCLHKYNQHL